jgi:transglutaminase-like putative cysteine protease
MYISVGHEISLVFPQPTATTVMLHLHPSEAQTIRVPERFEIEPAVPFTTHLDLFGNRFTRLVAPTGRVTFRNSAIVQNDGLPDHQALDARQHLVQDLPADTLVFLLASRYCEVDSELKQVATQWFGHLLPGWSMVMAICNFVHRHLVFDYQQARADRTALQAYHGRIGVCRDYMHLAITLCRIMNIPARYCSGYLGDIGVPVVPPMDFSAWFEVYLGNRWHTFDARNNTPRIGRVVMTRGRDAADVALTTTFGDSVLNGFQVWTEEVHEHQLV